MAIPVVEIQVQLYKIEYTFCKSVLKDFLYLNEMMARSQNLGTILLNKLLKSKAKFAH